MDRQFAAAQVAQRQGQLGGDVLTPSRAPEALRADEALPADAFRMVDDLREKPCTLRDVPPKKDLLDSRCPSTCRIGHVLLYTPCIIYIYIYICIHDSFY